MVEDEMGKHYMLECEQMFEKWVPGYGRELYYARLRSPKTPPGAISWRVGQKFKNPPQEPIEIAIIADPTMPKEFRDPDDLKEFYNDTGALVMTKRLYQALCEAGVDNIDAYSTIIRNPVSGFETTDYIAGNLLGLVKCVNLSRSNVVGGSSDHRLDTDFEGLVIDETQTDDLFMFRLLENTSAVVIHERIKNYLLERGFHMLKFVPPEKWVG
jgi:hypothetical protein